MVCFVQCGCDRTGRNVMYSNSVRELLYRISILICSMVRIMMVRSTLATSYNAIIMDRPPLVRGGVRLASAGALASCSVSKD